MAFSAGHFTKQPYRPEPWDTGDNKSLDELLSTEQWELDFGINRYPRYLLDFPSLGSEIPDAVESGWGRNSAARFLNSNGLYESASSDTPRLQYPFGSGDPGLLVEAAGRTNQILNAANPSAWVTRGPNEVSFTDKTSIHADEASNSDVDAKKVNADGSSAFDRVQRDSGTLSGGDETYYAIAEKASADKFWLQIRNATSFNVVARVAYEFSTDTLSTPRGSTQDTNVRVLSSSGPNGGKLVEIRFRVGSGNGENVNGGIRRVSFHPDVNLNGDGTIFHHAQAEEAPNASSPIVTQGSPVTRAADDYAISLESWYNQNQGTFIFDIVPLFYRVNKVQNETLIEDPSNNDSQLVFVDGPTPPYELTSFSGGDELVLDGASAFEENTYAVSYNGAELKASLNGDSKSGIDGGRFGNMTKLVIGGSPCNSFLLGKGIYVPRALPESTLNAITAQ